MLSPKFEHVKQRYPGLSPLLDRVGQYIQSHVRDGQEYVIPKLAAAALHLNDGEAFVLLDLLAAGSITFTAVRTTRCWLRSIILKRLTKCHTAISAMSIMTPQT
jgi:hypothetical protein